MSGSRQRWSIAAAMASAMALAVAVTLALTDRALPRATPPAPLPSVTVARGELQQAQTVAGSVGYGAPWTLSSHGSGTITWLPQVGATIRRGQQLYRVDDAPVSLFYGDLPLYRTLRFNPGSSSGNGAAGHHAGGGTGHGGAPTEPPPPPQSGHDVQLVATNLAALGFYTGDPAYATYDAELAYSVRAWQHSIGAPETGVISPADVAVASGPVRVDSVLAHLDDSGAEQVLSLTGTARVITLEVSKTLAQSLAPGRRVLVTLPDGNRVRTRIARIGAGTSAGYGAGGQTGVPVTVTAAHPSVLARDGLGSVSASIVTAARRDVLYVPITALLALAGGGYALQRPDHALVPVRIGMVANGEVQVSGIAAGARVLVAQ